MEDIYFANPEFLWLLILIPLLSFWHYYNKGKVKAKLSIPTLKAFESVPSLVEKLHPILFIFRLIALSLLILAISRPQTVDVSSKTKTNRGIDIVMAIDVSSSMLAQDLKPNRLTALKNVASDFINQRTNDRIGLIVYAGESYTKTPITSDKQMVKNTMNKINFDGVIDDGTAIGMGLATAVNRLKDSRAKSKVIILLTDGAVSYTHLRAHET